MKFKAILFDADGMTIISQRFSDRIQAEYGIPWEKMKPFFDGPFQECKRGKADLKEELSKVIEDLGWKGSAEELMDYWFKTGSELNPQMIEFVKELRARGIKCFLATNQEKYRADYLCQDVGLGDIFDGLFVSAELGCTKDDPAFFQKILERMNTASRPPLSEGVLSEQILFVDHEEKNIKAAQSVGLSVYLYHDFDSFKEFVLAYE